MSVPGHTRPVSYYALFQGWLLLSQPPGCLRARTALPTQPPLRDLSRRSGLFPSRRRIFALAVSLPPGSADGIRSLVRCGRRQAPVPIQCSTSVGPPGEAAPKSISGRTSYLRVRLAFHPYPQLLRAFCNRRRCGPPRALTRASAWPWVAHPVSGRPPATARPVQTRFRSGSGWCSLRLATDGHSPVHSPIGTPSPLPGL